MPIFCDISVTWGGGRCVTGSFRQCRSIEIAAEAIGELDAEVGALDRRLRGRAEAEAARLRAAWQAGMRAAASEGNAASTEFSASKAAKASPSASKKGVSRLRFWLIASAMS